MLWLGPRRSPIPNGAGPANHSTAMLCRVLGASASGLYGYIALPKAVLLVRYPCENSRRLTNRRCSRFPAARCVATGTSNKSFAGRISSHKVLSPVGIEVGEAASRPSDTNANPACLPLTQLCRSAGGLLDLGGWLLLRLRLQVWQHAPRQAIEYDCLAVSGASLHYINMDAPVIHHCFSSVTPPRRYG